MIPALPRLHAVTDDRIVALSNLLSFARALAAAGPLALHLRAPGLTGAALLALARQLQNVVTGTASRLIVNDRADVARICGAGGVHLPEQGLPIAAARALLPAGATVGRSVHSAEDARRAADQGADYVFLGPIWETPSHPGRPPLGPDAIAAAQPARVIAIGGVTPERARVCREAGAYGVAAIRAVWEATSPGLVVQQILLSLGNRVDA